MAQKPLDAPAFDRPLFMNARVNEGSGTNKMNVGDTFAGTLSTTAENDMIEIELEAGTTYTFNVWGVGGTSDGVTDTFIEIFSPTFNTVAFNDDIFAPQIQFSGTSFTPDESGTYTILVTDWNDDIGDYVLQATDDVWSPAEVARWLTQAGWGVPTTLSFQYPDDKIRVNLSGLNDGKALARAALDAWSDYTGVNFVETSGNGDITFTENVPGATAGAGPTDFDLDRKSGVIYASSVVVSDGWIDEFGDDFDTYSFQTYIHEIGHALGLAHGGPYDLTADYGVDNFYRNDSVQMSVMSYFAEDNTFVGMSEVTIVTPMIADILAMEWLYGSYNAHTGNTVWGSGSNVGGYLEDIFDEYFDGASRPNYGGGAIGFTVKDDGGTDLLDFSTARVDQKIDLRQARASDINGETGNMVIARDTVIENASSGSGDDRMIGNGANNILRSGKGVDTVGGGGGDDRIYAEGANSALYGNDGDDFMSNDIGRSYFSGGAGNDIVAYFGRGSGVDVNLETGANNTGSTYNSVEGIIGTGSYSDTLVGNDDDNTFFGNGGNDRIDGKRGDDSISGGAGNDRLTDFSGKDTFNGGTGQDTVSYLGRSVGIDVNLKTGSNNSGDRYISIEHLIGSNNGEDDLRGTDGDNRLRGIHGDDRIFGYRGDDTLDGGNGDDYLRDDSGSDIFIGGEGDDTVSYYGKQSDTTVRLISGYNNSGDTYSSIENLMGSNLSSDNMTGNGGANQMWGFGDDDDLNGADGDDRINGGRGNDTLEGGGGDDYLRDDSGADTFIGGSGDDTVSYYGKGTGVTVSLITGANNSGDSYDSIENLMGSNNDGDDITGDGAANKIWGFGGDDNLNGADGNDTIEGGDGSDTLQGGGGDDEFVFDRDDGSDTIVDFQDGGDKIVFDISGLGFGDLAIADVAGGASITYDGDDVILVENITEAQLTSADFVFV